jgi:DNA-binding MarR family transcriptional regulator
MSELSRELGVSLSALTQIADRLERAQLVIREATGSDRRVRRLRLTPQGEDIMRRREAARAARIASVLATLPTRKREEVLGAFETLLDACLNIEKSESRAVPAKAVI